jgi:hypothetical protein
VTPNGDGSSTGTLQPGAIRKAWHWYWSFVVYLVGWALIWAQPLFVFIMAVFCVFAEKLIKAGLRERVMPRAAR